MQGHTKPKCPQLSKVDKEKAKKTASNRVVKIAKLAQSSKVGMEVDNCSDSDSEGNELKELDVEHKSTKTSLDLDDDMDENILKTTKKGKFLSDGIASDLFLLNLE